MISLAQKLKLPKIDWRSILTKYSSFSEKQKKEYLSRMEHWVTCPCGQSSIHLPREDDDPEIRHTPKDELLYTLGYDIYDALKCGDIEKALHYLTLIEMRVAFLVNQEKNKLKEEIAVLEKQLFEKKKIFKTFD